jgi:hypothetical protein
MVAQRKDLAGNVRAEYLARFTLLRRLQPGQDGAQWLLEFENWLQERQLADRTPQFGDVPSGEKLRLQKGECKRIPRLGAGLCTVILAAEFEKTYKVGGGEG